MQGKLLYRRSACIRLLPFQILVVRIQGKLVAQEADVFVASAVVDAEN